jgi:DNA (cytosine-5)-methyltransferase 1
MKIGSLCTGYGGLDLAAEEVFNAHTVWTSDIDKHASKLIELKGQTNLGNLKLIDWSQVKPIDILTAGYPCQPFSVAGHRKGTDDPRHLWPWIKEAISQLRPSYVILENVKGHLTLGFSQVLADLAEIGFNAEWTIIRAADIGATHRRARLYVLAYPNDRKRERVWEMPKLGIGYNSRANLQMHEGRFSSVIDRWETVLDRSYPPPLEEGKLNPVFVEWMMGLPEGWVTGHGIPRSSALKLLGNGVVPQQAKAAIQIMLYNMSRASQQPTNCDTG